MQRPAAVASLLIALAAPRAALAAFHQAVIDELMSGFGGDTSVQFVEIRMITPNQNLVAHTRLTAFSCDGTAHTVLIPDLPKNVPNNTGRWIMGTAAFGGAACLQPDFTFPDSPGIPSCGMVCWGAPANAQSMPVDPSTWDAGDPNQYVDCVAFGGYTGPKPFAVGTPSPFGPGDGTQSLTRIGNSAPPDDSVDFDLRDPTPTNNAGVASNFLNPCPTTTTTSTTTLPRVGSTTTTLPAGGDFPLTGRRLVLKDNAKNPGRRSLLALSSNALSLAAVGSSDDPTLSGGALRVRTAAGCGTDGASPCDTTFELPARLWARIGKGTSKTYRQRDPGGASSPVRLVLLKPGRGHLLKVMSKGAGLPSLAANPGAVDVVVTTGARRYCLRFDDVKRFRPERVFIASGAAPGACP